MPRGSGKFKQKRGGGRNFSRNLVLNEDGIAVEADSRGKRRVDDDEDDSEEEKEEEEEEEEEESEDEEGVNEKDTNDGPESSSAATTSIEDARASRKADKKQKKQPQAAEEDPDLVNPNRLPMKHLAISELSSAPRELSRKEREAKEKAEAKEKYWKLHQAGKTDQAKADLARLAKIRAEREAAQVARKAEEEGE
ncbi:hypothetical protein CPB86DRAFT_709134 [Serendipita vermifera]|nr:hypothetical protein CPB86DRAFT_709134 [Serendipita vermifera]